MARREADIEAKVTRHAEGLGWRARKVAYVGRRGAPDRWFKRPVAQLVIVEFKDPRGTLSPHQRREIAWLQGCGFEAHVISSVEAGVALFDSFGPAPRRNA